MTDDIGRIWADCGVLSECGPLRAVLMHRPGDEILSVAEPRDALWIEAIDLDRAQEQHDKLVDVYRSAGVTVHFLDESPFIGPNSYFCRDLFAMTPLGAIIGRPASSVRAGEERSVAATLARLGVPIIHTIYGDALFEGADVAVISPDLVFIGEGARTNRKGADQVRQLFLAMGFGQVELVQLNYGCGHLDGVLNIVSNDLAILYPSQVSYCVWETLRNHGFRIISLPDQHEAQIGMAINMVPLSPGRVVIPAGNRKTSRLLEEHAVECIEVDVSELMKGGGAIHCMTGVVARGSAGQEALDG